MIILEYQKKDFTIKELPFYSMEVKLPKTTLLIVGNDFGFFMCGALDVDVYNAPHLIDRGVICGNVVGVKTIDDLLNAPLKKITKAANDKGVFPGMLVKDALLVIS